MRTNDEIREDRHRYESGVEYEVWRHGGNPDNVNHERVEENYYQGTDVDSACNCELKAQTKHIHEEQQDEAL